MAVQSDQLERRLVQDALCGRDGATVGQREAELLVVDARRHRRVSADVDARRHADQHPLRATRHARQVGDLHRRINDDTSDAGRRGFVQFVDRFGVAVQHDSGRVHAACQRDRINALNRHGGIEQGGFARSGTAASQVGGGSRRLREHDGGDAGTQALVVGMADAYARHVGNEVTRHARSPLRATENRPRAGCGRDGSRQRRSMSRARTARDAPA